MFKANTSLSATRSKLSPTLVVGVALFIGLLFLPMALSDFRLQLMGKFLTLAMVAVGIGLAWGQGGMLTMGQGVFFGLGGYIMALHLKLTDAGPGGVPDFMTLYGTGEVPGLVEPLRNPAAAMAFIVLIPALLAFVLGISVFRRKVRGAYFAILTQALVAAFAILLIGQQHITGGTNGLTGFRSFFGYDLTDPLNHQTLFYIAVGVLTLMVLATWQLKRSRFGELLIASRDQEDRVRFLGYDPAVIKVIAFVISAVFASIGGALFVPIVGIISPADVGVVASIGFIVGVAIGGRTTILGPALGTIAVAWGQTTFSEAFPSAWTYFLGALFVVVIAFLPGGLAALPSLIRSATPTRQSPIQEAS